MEEEVEIDLYAHHMYKYLLPRRMELPEGRQIAQKEKDLFTTEVGKAVLVTCYEYQEKFQKKFYRDYPKFVKDLCYFMRYSAEIGFALYDDREDDVFESVFLLTTMILELAAFCHAQGHESLKFYSDVCWAEIFKNHFKDNFFENGGWKVLNCRSQKKAKFYDITNRLIDRSPHETVTSHHWLTRFDRSENSTKDSDYFESDKFGEENNVDGIPKEQLFETLKTASTMNEQSSEDETVNNTFSANQSPLQEFQSKYDIELAKSPIKFMSLKSQGAIPKSFKKFERSVEKKTKTNIMLLECFRDTLLGDDNVAVKQLRNILNNDENLKLLLKNGHFLRQVEAAIEGSDNKRHIQKMLEDSLRIINHYTIERSHCVENSIDGQSVLHRNNNSKKELNGRINLYKMQNLLINECESNKLFDKNIGLSNEATQKVESYNQTPTPREFYYSEHKLDLPKLHQTINKMSENDENNLPKIDTFNKMTNLKIEYDFIKQQIESGLSPSHTSQQELKIDEQINKIVDAFRAFDEVADSNSDEYFHEEYLELQKLLKKEQVKMAKIMIRQSLGINMMETNSLLRMAKIFTAQKNPTVHAVIMFCLIENSRANRRGRQILKLGASDVDTSQTSNETLVSDISKVIVEKKNELTLAPFKQLEIPCNSNTKSYRAEEEFTVEEAKKAAIKLVIAHHRSKKLLLFFSEKLDNLKLNTLSKIQIPSFNICIPSSLNSRVISEVYSTNPFAIDIPEGRSVLKSPTGSADQFTNQSPKLVYTDSSNSPTSINLLRSLTSRTVSPDTKGFINSPQNLASSSLSLHSTAFSTKHGVKTSQRKETKTMYMDARQEVGSSSSGEDLFHDASAGWSSDKDAKQQNRLSPVKEAVETGETSRKKKKKKKRRK